MATIKQYRVLDDLPEEWLYWQGKGYYRSQLQEMKWGEKRIVTRWCGCRDSDYDQMARENNRNEWGAPMWLDAPYGVKQ